MQTSPSHPFPSDSHAAALLASSVFGDTRGVSVELRTFNLREVPHTIIQRLAELIFASLDLRGETSARATGTGMEYRE